MITKSILDGLAVITEIGSVSHHNNSMPLFFFSLNTFKIIISCYYILFNILSCAFEWTRGGCEFTTLAAYHNKYSSRPIHLGDPVIQRWAIDRGLNRKKEKNYAESIKKKNPDRYPCA